MTKWFNRKVNEFFRIDFNKRETDLIGLTAFSVAVTAFLFVLFNAIFPNC